MFLLPGPWLHVNRELIEQMSITWAPWREGSFPLCWAYMSTTHACSQADGDFYVLPTRHRSCWSYSVQSPDCQARDRSAPTLLGHGMWCRDCTAFKTERFMASLSLAVKNTLYSDFPPLKLLLVTPVTHLVSAESSLSHQFKFWRQLYHLGIGWCLAGRWNLVGRRASQLCIGCRYFAILWWLTRFFLQECWGVEALKVILEQLRCLHTAPLQLLCEPKYKIIMAHKTCDSRSA